MFFLSYINIYIEVVQGYIIYIYTAKYYGPGGGGLSGCWEKKLKVWE